MTGSNTFSLANVKERVLHAGKTLYERGLVEGTAGNVSGRVEDGNVVMTPSSLSYEDMTLDDLVVLGPDGTKVEGDRSPTSEKALHLAVFRDHSDVQGVVHCHAKHASMFVARTPIPAAIDEFIIYLGGDVPVCDYFPSGSDELGDEVARHFKDRSAALMANHGMVAIGKDVDDAMKNAMCVEHNAEIIWGASLLGNGVVPLGEPHVTNFTNIYGFIREHMWGSD